MLQIVQEGIAVPSGIPADPPGKLAWAKSRGDAVDPLLFEVAQATQLVNLARDMRDAVPAIQAKVRTLVD